MENQEKKVVDAVSELINSLNDKVKELNIDEIKKLTEKENAAALGLIACCNSIPAKTDKKSKAKKKK